MKTRTTPQNPQTPPRVSKKAMLETIQQAVSEMEKPWDVTLTARAKRVLMAQDAHLTQAYRMSWYVLNWDYQRIPNDDRQADYNSVKNTIAEALYLYDLEREKPSRERQVHVFRAVWSAWKREQATEAAEAKRSAWGDYVTLVTIHDWKGFYGAGCIPQPCAMWLADCPPSELDIDLTEQIRPLVSSGWDMPIEESTHFIPRFEVRRWCVPKWALQGMRRRRDVIGAFKGMNDAQLSWWVIDSSDEYAKAPRVLSLSSSRSKFCASLREQWASTGDLSTRQINAVLR